MAIVMHRNIDRESLHAWVSESRQRIKAARPDANIGAVDLQPMEDRNFQALQDAGIRTMQDLGALLQLMPGETVVLDNQAYSMQTSITVHLPAREAVKQDDATPTFVDLMAA